METCRALPRLPCVVGTCPARLLPLVGARLLLCFSFALSLVLVGLHCTDCLLGMVKVISLCFPVLAVAAVVVVVVARVARGGWVGLQGC